MFYCVCYVIWSFVYLIKIEYFECIKKGLSEILKFKENNV